MLEVGKEWTAEWLPRATCPALHWGSTSHVTLVSLLTSVSQLPHLQNGNAIVPDPGLLGGVQ